MVYSMSISQTKGKIMATKASIKALAKRQGAKFSEGRDGLGLYWAEVELPVGKMWDNGNFLNFCHKSQWSEDLPIDDLWQEFEDELTCAVIDEL